MGATQIKSEILLTALLSRPRLTEQHKLKAGHLLDNSVSMTTFKRHVDRQRVSPCVYCNIRDHFKDRFPAQLVDYLHKQYIQNVKRNKIFLKTFFTLLDGFKLAGIPVAPVKGIHLAQILYGDIAKRHFNDIDLLVHPNDLLKANETLNGLGFYCEVFNCVPTHIVWRILEKQKDLVYLNAAGVILELHIRLANVPTKFTITFEELLFTIPQQSVFTRQEAFLYLCWHGMNTFFHRLKWLCDLAIMIDTMDIDWEHMYATARELDCLRTLTISLLLSHLVFETILPSQALKYYSKDRVCRRLFNIAKKNIISDSLPSSFTFKSVLAYILLPKSWKNKVGGLAFLCKPGYNDFKILPIFPKKIGVFYYFVRPLTFLWRRIPFMHNVSAIPSK